jgi:hypothetical protein
MLQLNWQLRAPYRSRKDLGVETTTTKVCVAGVHHSAPLRSIVELESPAVEAPIEAGFELE